MSTPFAIAGPLPQTWTLVDAVYALLRADSTLYNLVGSVDDIYKNEFPEDLPDDAGALWARLLVSLPVNPFGERSDELGYRSTPLILTAQVNDAEVSGYDPRRMLAVIGERVFVLLNNTRVTLAVGGHATSIYLDNNPSDPRLLPELDALETKTIYRTILKPVTP